MSALQLAALSSHDEHVLVFVLGIAVLLAAAYTAYRGRAPAAAVMGVIGVFLVLLVI